MTIVKYGNPILKQKATPVWAVTEEVRDLAKAMVKAMHAVNGVGLAAPQVGRGEALCVIDIPPDAEDKAFVEMNAGIAMPLIMINPEITELVGTLRRSEGCLSFPDLHVDITRAKTVTFSYTDMKGQRQTATASGLLARAVQHELDHIHGVLLFDKMSPAQRLMNKRRLRDIKEEGIQESGSSGIQNGI